MIWNTGSIIIAALAALGCAAALVAFLRTPAPQRWRLRTAAWDREQARRELRVQRGELVPIPAQPRRALRLVLPYLLLVSTMLAGPFAKWFKLDLACTHVAGWNAALLLMGWTLWVLPVVLSSVAIMWTRMAWRGWRVGCFPPPDAVLLAPGFGDRTWRGRLQAGLAMLVLPLAVWVLVLSIQLHQSLLQGRSTAELTARLEQGCPRP